MQRIKKVIVLGFDGLDPRVVDRLLGAGQLPNFARVRDNGGYARVATTYPAQTPVAWSTFATGLNPGGHGIFDFLRRDPATYLPQLALNHYEQKNPFVPPKVVNRRKGKAVWESLSEAGISSVVLRCPCTYPAEDLRGRLLAGMGVPDLRGSLGTSTFYSTDKDVTAQEGESIVALEADRDGNFPAYLLGPINPRTRQPVRFDLTIEPKASSRQAILRSAAEPRELRVEVGQWSDWLRVKFKVGMLQSARGMIRFYLVRTEPTFELYASPVNFDPDAPVFPISAPPEYAGELQAELGTFYTTGMIEDHGGLNNGRISEEAYLDQCAGVWREREAMLLYELGRFDEGLLFCLFDTPDRVQHMFHRFGETDHPANRKGLPSGFEQVIEDQYRACDASLGKVLEQVDDETLLIALSDHGFDSFRRGVHLNAWAYDQGLLSLKNGVRPGEEAGDLLRQVDWDRTKVYSLGLGGMYLNLKGREKQGIVESDEAEKLKAKIAQELTGLEDREHSTVAIRSVIAREQVYRGEHTHDAPDLLVNFSRGYRASWGTALGAVPEDYFEDNTRRWSGDHIIDPSLVPGVLFMNHVFRQEGAGLIDLAPTILQALGVPKEPAMEGEALLE